MNMVRENNVKQIIRKNNKTICGYLDQKLNRLRNDVQQKNKEIIEIEKQKHLDGQNKKVESQNSISFMFKKGINIKKD